MDQVEAAANIPPNTEIPVGDPRPLEFLIFCIRPRPQDPKNWDLLSWLWYNGST